MNAEKPEKPRVSIRMITYNHEPFIAQAIESVLMQRTSFPIELIIGEDCSTDGTAKIVAHYATKSPKIIKAIIREKNVGMRSNDTEVEYRAQGEFVAILEGDDYWTDPFKLQKQIDYLEAHPECTICAHYAQIVHADGTPTGGIAGMTGEGKSRSAFSDLAEILRGNHTATCSLLYRKSAFDSSTLSGWADLPYSDWPTQIMLATKGPMGFIPEIMGAYRVHPGGVWSSSQQQWHSINCIKCLEVVYPLVPESARKLVFAELYQWYGQLINAHVTANNKMQAVKLLLYRLVRFRKLEWPRFDSVRWLVRLILPKTRRDADAS